VIVFSLRRQFILLDRIVATEIPDRI